VKSYHFDLKLKPETVPQWDGNANTLARWLNKINHLADGSVNVHQELGKIVPRRFTRSAETWYYSIPDYEHIKGKVNWSCLRNIISGYWMNHHWLEKQKLRANKARFREVGHQRESPSEYIIRKLELIGLVYNYTDLETIQAIMEQVPDSWASILNPQYLKSIMEFQNTVKYHEETLAKLESPTPPQPQRLPNWEFSNTRFPYQKANVNLVGWSKNIGTPQFPKDDKNVSPRRTPESIGAWPCRHCGSSFHWDNECRHSWKGEKMARVNSIQLEDDDLRAQEDYNNLFYNMDSDSEEGYSEKPDFCEPLQCSDLPVQHANPSMVILEDVSSLKGTKDFSEFLGTDNLPVPDLNSSEVHLHNVMMPLNFRPNVNLAKDLTSTQKIPLNRNSRRCLARDIAKVHYSITHTSPNSKPLVELKKYLAWPLGCSFLGAQATQVIATINSLESNSSKVIVDLGSDITLISFKTLLKMQNPPKIKQGQRINSVQVTGNASISGYVEIDLYFHTQMVRLK